MTNYNGVSGVGYRPEDNTDDDRKGVSGIPNVNKDFKKILGQARKDEKDGKVSSKKKSSGKSFVEGMEEENEEVIDETSEVTSLKPSEEKNHEEDALGPLPSPFDLSKSGTAKKAPPSTVPTKAEAVAATDSPATLFQKASSMKKPNVAAFRAPQTHNPAENLKKGSKESYMQEQPDLSYVNPNSTATTTPLVNPMTPTTPTERPTPLTPDMQRLIEQVVKSMYTVGTAGQTDTVMTLQYPPIFKDATLMISTYDTAKGQFNISFGNLTQEAQKLLDLPENRGSLYTALEQKGYNIQIMSTSTTQIENRFLAEEPQSSRHGSRERDEDSRGGGQSDSEEDRH